MKLHNKTPSKFKLVQFRTRKFNQKYFPFIQKYFYLRLKILDNIPIRGHLKVNKAEIQISKKGFTSFELIQVNRMMDCQFEAVIHGKDGLGCWAIEGKVIIHMS